MIDFIAYGKSIEMYAKFRKLKPDDVRRIIEEVRDFPCVREELEKTLKSNSSRYIATIYSIRDKIISGEMGIQDVVNLPSILEQCDYDQGKEIREKVARAIISGKLSIYEYFKIFALPNNSTGIKSILEIIVEYRKDISIKDRKNYLNGLNNELNRIKAYETQYRVNCNIIEQIGYVNQNGEKVVVKITDEHRKMSVAYLYSIDEYVCKKTMIDTLGKIVRGEITPEIVERAKKEKELRLLQKKDYDLDEAIREVCRRLGIKSY